MSKDELKQQFPWLGTDEQANGAEVVDDLAAWYESLEAPKQTATATGRLAIVNHVIDLLKECRMASPEHFPGLGLKVRAALKSAYGAQRHLYRQLP